MPTHIFVICHCPSEGFSSSTLPFSSDILSTHGSVLSESFHGSFYLTFCAFQLCILSLTLVFLFVELFFIFYINFLFTSALCVLCLLLVCFL